MNEDEQIGTLSWSAMGGTENQARVENDHAQALAQLASELSRLRAERRISVAALASRAGLGRTTASKALNGAAVPSEETVIALAQVLSADPRPLLRLRRQALDTKSGLTSSRKSQKPRINGSARSEESAFEAHYRQYIENRWGKLSVIGLDVAHPERSSWPLDVAYLGLSLGEASTDLDSQNPHSQKKEPTAGIRVEQALVDRTRILIRGLAGCGKTTLLQWLAVCAARRNMPSSLTDLNDRIPFLLRLRTLVRTGTLPTPGEYLRSIGCQLADSQPQGWTDSILTQGRGLILVDGVDEVAQDHRDKTREWLQELLASYPNNYFVVTTRPSAVREGWLYEHGFSELNVQPMSPREVAVFIDRWHKAAEITATAEEKEQLERLNEKLRDTIRSQRGLAQMATSPLLSALVCALHRDRHGHLPSGRMELYEAALSLLLYRRDRERQIEAGKIILSERQSLRLLQRLAYWMVDNGQNEISRSDAIHHIADALPAMPEVSVQGSADQILDHLVDRSGLVRTPDDETVDFVHRTFQDYLAARSAVERRNFGALVNHANDDRWEDVIRMAVAHASPEDAQHLLQRLISRGDRNTSNENMRHRLHLLAAASVDYATELDPQTRDAVRSRVSAVLPPRSVKEATTLARVGPVILDLLPGPEGLKSHEAAAVVHLAGLLGGDPALTLLKQYRAYTEGDVPFYLQLHWHRHDISDYAREVLSHNPGITRLTISTPEQIKELRRIKTPRAISFQGEFRGAQMAEIPGAEAVSSLTISYNSELGSLDFINSYPSIRRLTIDICRGLSHLAALNDSPVQHLSVWKSPLCLGNLPQLTNLRTFRINSQGSSSRLHDLLPAAQLNALYLGPMNCSSLAGLSDWQTIEDLSLYSYDPVREVGEISKLPRLRRLKIEGPSSDAIVAKIPVMARVEFLTVSHSDSMDLARLVDLCPRLRALKVFCEDSKVIDVSALANVGDFSIQVEGASAVHGTQGFAPRRIIVR
ncbi:NACHT domain-containing protein [Streptomyces sindenensis]|uniref:NACHT domain-containing protein n=1 Tax=Streptomyces sindenensis TaxID=67363 RepID=A0ABW6EQJ3_9ACTN